MPCNAKAAHYTGLSTSEFALLCYLRLHPNVAKSYGIEKCSLDCAGCKGRTTCAGVGGRTSIGCIDCRFHPHSPQA